MKVLILTEGYMFTGYGHISRCTAIAKAFEDRNIDVSFVVNGDENVYRLLCNYPLLVFNWLEYSNLKRLSLILQHADIVVIDSYLAPLNIYEKISLIVPVCVYLDDYNRIRYPKGIVVNGTVGAELIPYDKGIGSDYLLGKDYVILREPFRDISYDRIVKPEIKTILVTFGGSDPLHITPKVLSVLTLSFPKIRKNVVLGPAFSQVREIEKLADVHTVFYRNIDAEEMKNLMLESDLAISAAGQTVNELAITGLPSILYKVASNQEYNIKGWLQNGFIDSYIDLISGKWSDDELKLYIEQMFSKEYRSLLSLKGRLQIDGKGASRITTTAYRMFCLKTMTARLAMEADIQVLFDLANDKLVRNNSFSTDEITWDEHLKWFTALLKDPSRKLLVFYFRDDLIGQVRFDLDTNGESAVISISIAPPFRGLGLASYLLKYSLCYYHKLVHAVQTIYAYVKSFNESSKSAFLKAGFKCSKNDSNQILKFYYIYEP